MKRVRPIRAAAYVILTLALLLAIRWGWRRMTAVPAPVMDYAREVMALTDKAQPPGEDGWARFEAVMMSFGSLRATIAPEDGSITLDYPPARSVPFEAPELEHERALMALIEQQGVLEELDSLALLPRFVRPIDPGIRPLDILMPDLERSRALARLLAWRAEHHWRRGESSDALAMIDRILTLARVTSLQPMLLPRLVGAAILAMTQDQIRQALLLDEIPADLLLPLAHRLFETERALPYLASAIESERIFGHWIIQSVFTDDGHGNGSLDFAKLRKLTDAGGGGSPLADGVMNILTVFYADRVETLAQYDDAMQNLIDASRLPAQHRPPNWRWGSHTAHLDWRFPLVKVAMPALDHAIDNDDIIRLDLRATTIMLCIHAHRHQHGEWPPSLNELAPALLPALPLDPLTGVDFVYRLRPGAMALGPGYVLASPGPDGVVNIDTESDETAAPLAIRAYDRKASGSDVVFTLPPPLEETP